MTRNLIGGALCVLVLATSCGGDGDNASAASTTIPVTIAASPTSTTSATSATSIATTTQPPATSTAAPPTTEAGPTDEQQITAVVRRFYEVLIDANNPPDPESELWDEVATGTVLSRVRARSAERVSSGEGFRYPEPRVEQVLDVKVLLLESDNAIVNICLRDDTVRFRRDDGEVINDEVEFGWLQIALLDARAGWRVSGVQLIQSFDQEASCISAY